MGELTAVLLVALEQGLVFGQRRAEREDPAPSVPADWELFELRIARCLLTRTTLHGDPAPRHMAWKLEQASEAAST